MTTRRVTIEFDHDVPDHHMAHGLTLSFHYFNDSLLRNDPEVHNLNIAIGPAINAD